MTAPAGAGDALPFSRERQAAIDVVVRACRLVRQVQAGLVSAETLEKKDRSPVTVADYAAQTLIVHELTHRFPAYPFIAEESSGALRKAGPEKDELRARLLEVVRTALPADAVPDEAALFDILDRGGSGNCKSGDADPKSPAGLWWTLDPIGRAHALWE